MAEAARRLRVRLEALLAEYLGARTAASAVRLASTSWARRDPDLLRAEDMPAVKRGLEPILRTFLGAEVTATVLQRLGEGVKA